MSAKPSKTIQAMTLIGATALGAAGGMATQGERVKDANADRALAVANAKQFDEQRERAEKHLKVAAAMSRSQDETYRDCLYEKRHIRRVALDAYDELYGADGPELFRKATQVERKPARKR